MNNRKSRKLRWNRVVLLFVFLLLCMSLAVNALGSNNMEPRPMAEVSVQQGDSLWNLVKEYNPDYQGDVGKAVYEVTQINDLPNACLNIGDNISIPLDF